MNSSAHPRSVVEWVLVRAHGLVLTLIVMIWCQWNNSWSSMFINTIHWLLWRRDMIKWMRKKLEVYLNQFNNVWISKIQLLVESILDLLWKHQFLVLLYHLQCWVCIAKHLGQLWQFGPSHECFFASGRHDASPRLLYTCGSPKSIGEKAKITWYYKK